MNEPLRRALAALAALVREWSALLVLTYFHHRSSALVPARQHAVSHILGPSPREG